MEMSIIGMVLTIFGIIFILLWMFLFFTGKNRFKKETENVVKINKDKKLYSGLNGFLLPDMLFIGFRFMEIIGMELDYHHPCYVDSIRNNKYTGNVAFIPWGSYIHCQKRI